MFLLLTWTYFRPFPSVSIGNLEQLNICFQNTILFSGNMIVTGLINGIKVGQVGNYSNDVSDEIQDDLLSMATIANKLCNSTTKLMAVSGKSNIKLFVST